MAESTGSETILLDLDRQNAEMFLLEHGLNKENVLQNTMMIYKIFTGVKDKVKMTHLSKPRYNLQPKLGCDTWKPNLRFKTRPDELGVCSYEVMGEQCGDEWDEGCNANLQAAENEVNNMGASATLSAIQMAQVMQLRRGITDDYYDVAWFGDADFGTEDGDWGVDWAKVIEACGVKEAEAMKAMLQHCNGWWNEILATSNETNGIRTIDTVDEGKRADDPAHVYNFLLSLKNQAKTVLRNWNANRPSSERPVFLLQQNIFDAYVKYLASRNCESTCRLMVEGLPVDNVYTFMGYPVMAVPEWDMFDEATGNEGKYARAIFVAKENLCVGTGSDSLDGRPGSVLQIEQSPRLADKGKTFMYAHLKVGAGIANNDLIVAAFNEEPLS